MEHCEECGKIDVPLMAIVFSLRKKTDPNTLYTKSLYLCEECLVRINNYEQISKTIH